MLVSVCVLVLGCGAGNAVVQAMLCRRAVFLPVLVAATIVTMLLLVWLHGLYITGSTQRWGNQMDLRVATLNLMAPSPHY